MGNITLAGFDLEDIEKSKIHKIIQKYEKKLIRIIPYREISLRLKKSAHGKTFLHEVECKIVTDKGVFNSRKTDYNLFAVVDDVLKKAVNETENKNKKIQAKNDKEEIQRKRQAKT